MQEEPVSPSTVRGRPLRRAVIWLSSTALFVGLTLVGLALTSKLFGGSPPQADARLFEPAALAWILSFLTVYFAADGLRLYFVLRALDAPVKLRQIFPLVFINILFSNITPLATGGGFAQVWYLQRRAISVGVSAAATIIRTILAMLAIFIAAPLFQVLHPASAVDGFVATVVQSLSIFIALYLVGFLIVLVRPFWIVIALEKVLALLERTEILGGKRRQRWSDIIRREMIEYSNGFQRFLRSPSRYVLGSILATVIFLVTLFAFPALLMYLLDYDVDWLTVIGTLAVVTFLMYFAPTPGGAGFSELAFAGLMAGQINSEHLLLIIFAWRFLTIYLGMMIGLVVSIYTLRPERVRA